MGERQQRHVVFVPVALAGHLVSAVELAKLLLRLPEARGLAVTVIVLTPSAPDDRLSSVLSSASGVSNLSFLHLPPLSAPPRTPLPALMKLYEPHVRSALQALLSSSPVAALVLDFFCSNMIKLGLELGVPPYVFSTGSTSGLGLLLHHPSHIDPVVPRVRNIAELEGEAVAFPGFSSKLPLSTLPDVLSPWRDEMRRLFLDVALRLREARGFLVNSFDALQRGPARAFEENLYLPEQPRIPVCNVGPLLSPRSEAPDHPCLCWLDGQPEGSVVFLCFGSNGSFPDDQVREMAVGLERSGHGFLWVLRAPPEEGEPEGLRDAVLEEVLPEGFLERTRGRGLVWPSFAPQAEVLGHAAVGGFVTHCGWNSCLESLWFGVPMAAWPLYAEQHFNAWEMVKEIGAAVEVRAERARGNRAAAEEVERAVRALMGEEGAAVRVKVAELKREARKAVEVGGSSYASLVRVVEQWFGGEN